MYEQVEKPKENKSRAVANSVVQKKSNGAQGFGFVDNRPVTVGQRKLQMMANNYATAKNVAQKNSENLSGDKHPVQDKAENADAGAGLNMLLDNLEAAVVQASQQAEQEREEAPIGDLELRIKKLRGISNGNDEEAKQQIYQALKTELDIAGEAPLVKKSQAVQKKGWKPLAIGAGVVIGLGYLARRTYIYIRNREEDALVENYYRTTNLPPLVVPPELTAGLAGLGIGARPARLFQNINNFRFRYVGRTLPAQLAFAAHQGDCGTLMLMYEHIAGMPGIGFATARGNIGTRLLVNAQPIHGRNDNGNTEGHTDWYFQNHHWIIAGAPYDLLFMVTPPPAHTAYAANGNHNGVNYIIFADGRTVIEPGQANLGYDIQGEGRVFPNVAATHIFIAAHP